MKKHTRKSLRLRSEEIRVMTRLDEVRGGFVLTDTVGACSPSHTDPSCAAICTTGANC